MRRIEVVCVTTFLIIGLTGLVLGVFWHPVAFIVSLFLINLLILLVMLLQRRQAAKLQQRMLDVIRAARKNEVDSVAYASRTEDMFKKLVGMVQAQQISMEMLSTKSDDSSRSEAQQNNNA